ncbi:Ribonuclease H domain [Macleaya cordata]|uniref:Ribonuclease H domain n=1 Tax=Macleaya cordata TaxID=56857 RepID=A0A200PPZ8_MACCD|nr:Ribonuclease H domain [Macleaya cordata]
MENRSWGCTLLTQFSLCFALFLAFNIGGSQRSTYNTTNMKRDRPLDLYFLSVRGGWRSLKEQNHLLKQMEKVAKIYKVKFVVNISELGEDDPLMQNGTLHFSALKVPWYTTNASQGQENKYFLKQIPLLHGKILDIIFVDSGSLQEYFHTGEPSSIGSHQLNWLTRTLEATNSNWRVVIGLNPVVVCKYSEDSMETKLYEPLHDVFLKFGVNAYLSKQGCTKNRYTHEGSIAYIGNMGPADKAMKDTRYANESSIYLRFVRHWQCRATLAVPWKIFQINKVAMESRFRRGSDSVLTLWGENWIACNWYPPLVDEVEICCDGSARGNPRPAGAGVIFRNHLAEVILTVSHGLGVCTNYLAEITTILIGLEAVVPGISSECGWFRIPPLVFRPFPIK